MDWKKLKLAEDSAYSKTPESNKLLHAVNDLLDHLQAYDDDMNRLNRILTSIATSGYLLIDEKISAEDLKYCLDNTLPADIRDFIQHNYILKDVSDLTSEKAVKAELDKLVSEEIPGEDE